MGAACDFLSGTHAPSELEARIEAFLAGFAGSLADMPAGEFERHRASLLAAKLQKDRSLGEEADRHWGAIFDRRCGEYAKLGFMGFAGEEADRHWAAPCSTSGADNAKPRFVEFLCSCM